MVLWLNVFWQIGTLAIVAVGLAVVFGQLRIMNMAHGEMVMIGAYAPIFTASAGLPSWMQIPVCLLSVALVAFLVERLVIRHLYRRPFDSLLATWGISILLRELVELIAGREYQSVPNPIPGTFSVFGTDYPAYRIAVMLGIIVFFIVLTLWYQRSRIGAEIKAMVGNRELAEACGIDTQRLSTYCFMFGCMTAGLAGMVLAPTIRIDPLMGLDHLIQAFFALVVGGLGTLEGLGIGVGMIASTQSLLSAMTSQTYGYLAVLFISVLFLWLKPNGLYRRF